MQIKVKRLLSIVLLLIGLCPAYFAQQIASEIGVLSKGADVILTGKVIQQTSSWNEDKTRIYTDVTVSVDEFIKGNSSENTLIITHPGGEVGEVGELYTHFPKFKDNEEVLLFVKRNLNKNRYEVFKGEYGKISLINDIKTGEKMTTQNIRVSELKEQIEKSIGIR